jgi:hypothetical protein
MVKADDERPGGDGPPLSVRSGPACPSPQHRKPWDRGSPLRRQALAHPPLVLGEQDAAKFAETFERVVERTKDCLSVLDSETDNPLPAFKCDHKRLRRVLEARVIAWRWRVGLRRGIRGRTSSFLGGQQEAAALVPLAGRHEAGFTTAADVRPRPPRRGSRRAGSSPGAGRRPRHGAR